MSDRDYPSRPIPAILALIENRDEILLVQRGNPPNAGLWGLPGGGMELGETIFEAARRELLEETGIVGEDPRVIDGLDAIVPDADGRIRHHYVLIVVRFDRWSGVPTAASDASAVGWFSPAALDGPAILPSVAPLIRGTGRSQASFNSVNGL